MYARAQSANIYCTLTMYKVLHTKLGIRDIIVNKVNMISALTELMLWKGKQTIHL